MIVLEPEMDIVENNKIFLPFHKNEDSTLRILSDSKFRFLVQYLEYLGESNLSQKLGDVKEIVSQSKKQKKKKAEASE